MEFRDWRGDNAIGVALQHAIDKLSDAEKAANKQLKKYDRCSYKGASKQYDAHGDLVLLKKRICFYKENLTSLKATYLVAWALVFETDGEALKKLRGSWFENIGRNVKHIGSSMKAKVGDISNFYQKFYNENQWYRIAWDMTGNMAKILGDLVTGDVYDLINDGIAVGADIWAMSSCVSNNYLHSRGYYDDDIYHSLEKENDSVYGIDNVSDLAKTAGLDEVSALLKTYDYYRDVKDIFDGSEDIAKLVVGDYKEGKYIKYTNSEKITKSLKLKTSEGMQKKITENIANGGVQGKVLEKLTKGADISKMSKKMATYSNVIKYENAVGSVIKGKNVGQALLETTVVGAEYKDTKKFIDGIISDAQTIEISNDGKGVLTGNHASFGKNGGGVRQENPLFHSEVNLFE